MVFNVLGECCTDLFRSLFRTQVGLVLVGGRRLRAACRLVEELPEALGVISNGTAVVPERRAVAWRDRLWTPCRWTEATD